MNSGQRLEDQVWTLSGVALFTHAAHETGDFPCQMCSHLLEILQFGLGEGWWQGKACRGQDLTQKVRTVT